MWKKWISWLVHSGIHWPPKSMVKCQIKNYLKKMNNFRRMVVNMTDFSTMAGNSGNFIQRDIFVIQNRNESFSDSFR